MVRIKKKMRILLSLLTAAVMLSVAAVQANALIIYVDEFGYHIDADSKEAVIEDYNGDSKEIYIPEYIYDYRIIGVEQKTFTDPDEVILCFDKETDCYNSSLERGFRCVILQIGNVNFDDRVSISDVTVIQRMLAKLCPISKPKMMVSDVDSDGLTTSKDVTRMQNYLAGIIPLLG